MRPRGALRGTPSNNLAAAYVCSENGRRVRSRVLPHAANGCMDGLASGRFGEWTVLRMDGFANGRPREWEYERFCEWTVSRIGVWAVLRTILRRNRRGYISAEPAPIGDSEAQSEIT